MIPAKPMGTSFVVESLDAYVVTRAGKNFDPKFPIGYPPVHPHHSNSWHVGYHLNSTRHGNGIFRDFFPMPFYSVDTLSRGGSMQSSSNSPGFNADFLDCHPDFEGNPMFIRTPS